MAKDKTKSGKDLDLGWQRAGLTGPKGGTNRGKKIITNTLLNTYIEDLIRAR